MKKLLLTALVTGILFLMPAAEAAIETYIGEGSATMSEAETQDEAFERAKTKALRHAQEQAGVYIRSQSKMQDFELAEDKVETLTASIVKIINTKPRKSLSDDGVIQFFVTVTVQIDTDALQREIDRLRPKTPNDPPKPLEPSKPDETKVDEPKVEETKPVETKPEEKPVEQIKPPIEEIIEKPQPPLPPPPPPPPPGDEQSMISGLMDSINAERAKAGKKPLTRDVNLAKGAKERVKELPRTFAHKRPDGSNWWSALIPSYQNKSMWEYIHSGYENPQEVIEWYSQQSENKTLSGDYKTIGIAYLYDPSSIEKHYWVVILA